MYHYVSFLQRTRQIIYYLNYDEKLERKVTKNMFNANSN